MVDWKCKPPHLCKNNPKLFLRHRIWLFLHNWNRFWIHWISAIFLDIKENDKIDSNVSLWFCIFITKNHLHKFSFFWPKTSQLLPHRLLWIPIIWLIIIWSYLINFLRYLEGLVCIKLVLLACLVQILHHISFP